MCYRRTTGYLTFTCYLLRVGVTYMQYNYTHLVALLQSYACLACIGVLLAFVGYVCNNVVNYSFLLFAVIHT